MQNKSKITFIKNKRAKRISITFLPFEDIKVTIPPNIPRKTAHLFINQNHKRINQILRLRTLQEQIALSVTEKKISKKEAKIKLSKEIYDLSKQYGFKFNNLTFRTQKSRWGSCSSKNNLSINLKIIFLPENLKKFIIIHELAHLIHKNHSRKFWNLVAKYMPGYKIYRRELQKYSGILRLTPFK